MKGAHLVAVLAYLCSALFPIPQTQELYQLLYYLCEVYRCETSFKGSISIACYSSVKSRVASVVVVLLFV
jgi:hypothetical protein